MIDRYVAALRRELRGPVLLRMSMVREVRDGLRDAADAHRDAGASPRAAERLAVQEFGPVEIVAAGLREELAASTGRYLLTVLATLGVAQIMLEQHTWGAAAAAQDWPRPSAGYLTFAQAVDIMNIVVLLAAGLGVLVLGRGSRVVQTRMAVRVVAIGVVIDAVLGLGSGGALTLLAPQSPTAWQGPEIAAMTGLTVVSTSWCVWLAYRCLRLTSRRRVDPENPADHAAEFPPLPLPRG
ncbi:permease prefix domain 1-containing protein [Phytoactinopolyspora halotolerans]|uniref:permease prefix domain 1-containing protein n=1 Tax=Phytoactinopolyspora halotolerans TaxID=1981512 RepID=UPI001C2053FC|nr:permease prefix domain 1-containing protein [Phytoactinopolyspora halotolerans]